MCGFAGFCSSRVEKETLQAMGDTLAHRGPDAEGFWTDPKAGVAFGFRRLAILDLSPTGQQPMESRCGRYILMMNGEIYNFAELRADCESAGWSAGFRGSADTEILLAAIATFGVEGALRRATGMFAIALWDREERTLTLARDRFGEKPLYYGWQGNSFLFGSELKALRQHPDFHAEVDPNVLALYMRHNYIPAPYSIYRGIYKLRPGCLLTVRAPQWRQPNDFSPWKAPVPYWSLSRVVERRSRFAGSEEDAADSLETLLKNTVSRQMVADVPLGAFLSGGIDSSLVVGLMQATSSRPVKTFTIAFEEEEFDESGYAREVAAFLGTDHTCLAVSPQDTLNVVPSLADVYDEPFADASQVPTVLLSRLARSQVAVALSGDGGDEIFGGYGRYAVAEEAWSKVARVPSMLRAPVGAGIRAVPTEAWDRVFEGLGRRNAGEQIHRLGHAMGSNSFDTLYRGMVSQWKNPEALVPGAQEPRTELSFPMTWPALDDRVERMMYGDTLSYMPDDVLVKVDRAAMAASLETRAPLLDHQVAEFAWSLPREMRFARGTGKRVLRQVLYRHVPKALIERPKMGFGVPIDRWLRGPLREWAHEMLRPEKLDMLNAYMVAEARDQHQSGRKNLQTPLWSVLMFQAWRERWERK